ncbi:MAG: alpha/beta hydrolase [Gordonia sp. (in: high G+C Gram-positive bacteria)]|uniref:alpha/beta hydrolase n=1 Tax=Gordonia sp. (in: high G+C Gram-positive bacteria) TaxID=84139 RepID=UPI0039E6E216
MTKTSDWQPDSELAGYLQRVFELGTDPDGESPIAATLVKAPKAPRSPKGAVLYIHGFTDYFFHEPLADFFIAQGYHFYALDLRKCGRSRRKGQTAHYVSDLSHYDVELGLALDIIAEESGINGSGDRKVIVGAHSTGGLIVPLWVDRLRRLDSSRHALIGGLILNSPWLDLQGRAALRSPAVTAAIRGVGMTRKFTVLPQELSPAYGDSIHESRHGEWKYNLDFKPLGGFPVTFGWLRAIRNGHALLQAGLDVAVPSLVLRSDRSYFAKNYSSRTDRADAVLDVTHMARWAGCLGGRLTSVPVPGARHDVFLSLPDVRQRAYAEVEAWLANGLVPPVATAAAKKAAAATPPRKTAAPAKAAKKTAAKKTAAKKAR